MAAVCSGRICICTAAPTAAAWLPLLALLQSASTSRICAGPLATRAPRQVGEAEIKQAQKAEREADRMKGLLAKRFDFLDE